MGNFSYPTKEATDLKNAEALGRLQEIAWVRELDFETLNGELDDAAK